MKKRILSMLLAIFMVVGMLPTTAFAAESGDTTPAEITGVSITIDGVVYDSSNTSAEDPAVVTPDSNVILTIIGTNLHNGSDDHTVDYANGRYHPVNPDYCEISEDGTVATYAPSAGDFANSSNFEITYCNNYTDTANRTVVPTGIYLIYDDGIAEEDKAQITGMSITIDGVVYDSSNTSAEDPAVITPNTSFITITVHGTALQNCTTDHVVSYYSGSSEPILPDYLWRFEADGTGAYHYYSSASALSDFARNTTPFELQYSNNGSFSAANPAIGSGVYIVYDDSTGGEEDTTPAEITGVSITVDGVTYTEGDVTITPDTQSIIVTVTGTHFANLCEANILDLGPGLTVFMNTWRWETDPAANTATADFSDLNPEFGDHNGSEIMYSNDSNQNWTGTGIYLTYEKPIPDSAGKIVVDMADSYGDGWDGAAIEIYKNGSLETTVTVDERFNTVSLDYDSTATYEFKWVKGSYDYECSFTIYADGKEELIVDYASVFTNGETILTLDDTTGGEEEPIVIIQQPTDGEAKLGERYCVEVIAEGEGLTYQWYFRNAGNDVWYKSGVTDSTYDDVMTKARMNREVYCVITDSHGNSVTTETATLIAIKSADPAITVQPQSVNANYGDRFTVTVEAVGEGLTYQWYYLDPDMEAWLPANSRSATYCGTMSEKIDERTIYCVATDIWGNQAASNAVILRCERVELAITQQPANASAKMDEMFNVEVLAEGDGLKYQWYWRQIGSQTWNISGQRDNTYDDVMTKARHNREVYCVITDAWGNRLETDVATISGIPEVTLAIIRQPENQTVTLGDMFNVTFEARGEGLKYQWYIRQAGTKTWYTSAQKDNSYDDVMTKARHNRELYCVVTDAWGNTLETSPVVVIMATPKHELAITAQPENESVRMGETFCVTVKAQGDELKYQWYWRQIGSQTWNISGQRDNTYDDVMTKARAGREVRCVITDIWGNTVTTETAILICTDIPQPIAKL